MSILTKSKKRCIILDNRLPRGRRNPKAEGGSMGFVNQLQKWSWVLVIFALAGRLGLGFEFPTQHQSPVTMDAAEKYFWLALAFVSLLLAQRATEGTAHILAGLASWIVLLTGIIVWLEPYEMDSTTKSTLLGGLALGLFWPVMDLHPWRHSGRPRH
jgi:hypothetical protein